MFGIYLKRELSRRKKAALVIAMGLALGIALVITVNSVSAGMQQAQDKVLKSLYGLGTDMTVTKAQAAPSSNSSGRPKFDFNAKSSSSTKQSSDRVMTQGGQSLASSLVTKVSAQKGVASAVGALSLNVTKVDGSFTQGTAKSSTSSGSSGSSQQGGPGGRQGGGSTGAPQVQGGGASFDVNSYSVAGVDVTNQDLGPLATSKITSGKTFTATQTDAKVAVVSKSYAKENKYTVGKTFTISGTKYTVIGIATPDSSESTTDVYLPLKQAQTLGDAKNKVTTIYVKATDSKQITTVKATIQKNISGTTVTTSADLASTVSGSLSTASNLATSVGKWLSIAVLVAAFLVAALLTSSAVSRRVREFGTLKALGWPSRKVTRQVVGESIVNGLIGGALGIAIGLGAAYAVTAISPKLTAELGNTGGGGGGMGGGPGGGGPGQQAVKNTMEIALSAPVSVTTIALAAGLAIAGGLIAGAMGGWRASRMRPADALRSVA
ncbi:MULTISPECIES: ABC transporter permease [Streptomyces]|jgi:putative ABC transport system permease protein|uniref:FtsX-like permease family protein n=1 Tax=Streptomyces mirabilis TaxID=68239 RepID=A0ABU3UVT5_9ACTN|nr:MULTISPECIES: FtsX-like permease family protein [Streptomyces]KAF5997607.1 ABC transporter permease [Streptomyces sp. WAC00263]MCX4608317.1 FtsX-like permease family protein [Streptomyces mirabilis]MCX5348782.1 FtsX-like permease family protein [Streptomyces mirabilis]MCZ0998690.1 FtsX-like permease family protein [Streptomyces mirabilis]MDU8997820.1 FtsX-like permease family protein [Streptomyces mirabilis]